MTENDAPARPDPTLPGAADLAALDLPADIRDGVAAQLALLAGHWQRVRDEAE